MQAESSRRALCANGLRSVPPEVNEPAELAEFHEGQTHGKLSLRSDARQHHSSKLCPGGNPELLIHLAQVVVHRRGTDE